MNTLQNIFLKEHSFDTFSDAAVLEFMLTVAGVRGDIPSMINSLLETFGSYQNLFEARPEQLLSVKGITKKTATLISMVVPLARFWQRCSMNDVSYIRNTRDAEAFCQSLLMGKRHEEFYCIALSARCQILGYRRVSTGSLAEVNCYPRVVMECALNFNAYSVVLCHSHPGNTCSPSPEDISSTLQLQRMLRTVGIQVLDHIICTANNCYSMSQHGDFSYR